jgi:hypothetical protein
VNATEIKGAVGVNADESESGEATITDSTRCLDGVARANATGTGIATHENSTTTVFQTEDGEAKANAKANDYTDVNATEKKGAVGANADESESGEATITDSRQSDEHAATVTPKTVTGEDNAQDTLSPPTSRYTMDKKKLKKRIFPCPVCGHSADGSHRCGDCYAHVHVTCRTPFEGSPEGFGQLLCCGKCLSVPDEEEFTQV